MAIVKSIGKHLDRLGQRVVASCRLNADVGELAVQWAEELVESGCEIENVANLSYESAPYYWSEIKSKVRAAASDLGMAWPDDEDTARRMLAKSHVEDLLGTDGNIDDTLNALKQMYNDFDQEPSLYDFWAIWFGLEYLREQQSQYYWDGLTLKNYRAIVLEVAQRWVAEYGDE